MGTHSLSDFEVSGDDADAKKSVVGSLEMRKL